MFIFHENLFAALGNLQAGRKISESHGNVQKSAAFPCESFLNNGSSVEQLAKAMKLGKLEEDDDGLYIQDIMRGGILNDDPRIPRNLSE